MGKSFSPKTKHARKEKKTVKKKSLGWNIKMKNIRDSAAWTNIHLLRGMSSLEHAIAKAKSMPQRDLRAAARRLKTISKNEVTYIVDGKKKNALHSPLARRLAEVAYTSYVDHHDTKLSSRVLQELVQGTAPILDGTVQWDLENAFGVEKWLQQHVPQKHQDGLATMIIILKLPILVTTLQKEIETHIVQKELTDNIVTKSLRVVAEKHRESSERYLKESESLDSQSVARFFGYVVLQRLGIIEKDDEDNTTIIRTRKAPQQL